MNVTECSLGVAVTQSNIKMNKPLSLKDKIEKLFIVMVSFWLFLTSNIFILITFDFLTVTYFYKRDVV